MLTPKKPRASFEALWMRDTAYPRHVIDMHRHFLDRVPLLQERRRDNPAVANRITWKICGDLMAAS